MVPFTGAAGWDDKAYHAKVSLILAAGYIREYQNEKDRDYPRPFSLAN
jgi:hypothetical protein